MLMAAVLEWCSEVPNHNFFLCAANMLPIYTDNPDTSLL